MIKREIKTYKSINKMLYPKWKQFFHPSEAQQAKYLNKFNSKFDTLKIDSN